MFEAFTYEVILEDMLSRVVSDVDKREGSVIYDALAPAAYHLAEMYFYLDTFMDLVSGDTAVGVYLDRVAADQGLTRKEATYAIRKVETTDPINIGTRWAVNDVIYTITELLSENVYSAACEQIGEIGNTYSGVLESIDNVSGITAELTDILSSGENEETDEALRVRFYNKVQSAGSSGNKYDYRNWALKVPGCGDARVYPLWDGPGTVKVLVVDENMSIDENLPDKVFNFIETVRPAGATVTVENPAGFAVGISANVILDGTKTLEAVKTAFEESLTAYLKDTVFEVYSISYARIGSLLLSTAGVKDYDALQVNGSNENIVIDDNKVPICGAITLTEV
ncbi:putative phage protein gp47/JayE [Anaerotaenia torta]|uniref:baseplate J/gp47 family protein n=1 Tax=Anaerotaenia torta TaxID=433293 RepID=UPI003D254720